MSNGASFVETTSGLELEVEHLWLEDVISEDEEELRQCLLASMEPLDEEDAWEEAMEVQTPSQPSASFHSSTLEDADIQRERRSISPVLAPLTASTPARRVSISGDEEESLRIIVSPCHEEEHQT